MDETSQPSRWRGLIGYGRLPQSAVDTAVSELAEAVRAARQTTGRR